MIKLEKQVYHSSICESCGEEFGCGAKLEGCWCTEVKLSPHQADKLKAKFRDCLCLNCLKEYASTETEEIPA